MTLRQLKPPLIGVTLVSRDELYRQSDHISLHVALTTETLGMLNDEAFAKMKTHADRQLRPWRTGGQQLCAGPLNRENSRRRPGCLDRARPTRASRYSRWIKCSPTAYWRVYRRGRGADRECLAEHPDEYFNEGIAVNAVNGTAMTEEAYRAVAPYAALAERLGTFAAL
jgi:D-3-phosphoglycerate dehydrogenase